MTQTQKFSTFLDKETMLPVHKNIEMLAQTLVKNFENPDGIQAILLYGSGLWKGAEEDTIWDLYILVDEYRASTPNPFLKLAGHALPPNVYYTDTPQRCKYAVIRMDQFEKAAQGKTLTPQIWARFCQPCRIVYTRDETCKRRMIDALQDCTLTFHRKTLPLTGGADDAETIWVTGLKSTYANELRSEKPGRAEQIFNTDPAAFEARTKLALPIIKQPKATARWMRPLIKLVYFFQLLKATMTFQGGVDYALWKIERHSGVKVEANDFQRRYPLIGAWPLVWEIYRKGGFR